MRDYKDEEPVGMAWHEKAKYRWSHLCVLRMLTLDLMGPSAFLLLDLLFISVVDVNDTVCAGCRSQRTGNLVAVETDGGGHSFVGRIPRLEVAYRARSEFVKGARVLVGL